MKRWMLAAAFGGAAIGCTPNMNCLTPKTETARSARPADSRLAFRAPVLANQVNPENAKDKAQALNDELDRDLQAAIESRDK